MNYSQLACSDNTKFRNFHYILVIYLIAFIFLQLLPLPARAATEIVIDSVLASVDGSPITLKDLKKKADQVFSTKYESISIEQIKSDPKLSALLDLMINQNLLMAEAEKRKLKVTENDVERYIDQVAAQNKLSRQEFELALQQQGQNIYAFAEQAKIEVTRTKIMGQLAQSAPAVTDDELNLDQSEQEEQESEAENTEPGLRYKLREIFLPKNEDLEQRVTEVEEALEAGEDFAALAQKYSAGSNADSGGDLGEMAETDLSDEIKEAVADMDLQTYSEALEFEDGIRFFYLEARFEEGEKSQADQSSKEALRKELESRKLSRHFQQFFEKDIYKNHKIERKI